MKKYKVYSVFAVFLVMLSFLGGCEHKDEIDEGRRPNTILDVSKFVRLVDDSTDVAGMIEVSSNFSEIGLKWNIPAGCNVDTSLTSYQVHNGTCHIPIKWLERSDSVSYGPHSKSFNVGVLVSAGILSEYVHLVWADSVNMMKLEESQVVTRADDALPIAEVLTITPPQVLNMDNVIGGAMYVDFSGMAAVFIDPSEILESTQIDKTKLPSILRESNLVEFKWNPNAPAENFSTRVHFAGGSLYKTVNINYTVQTEEPLYWFFQNSTPSIENTLSSTNARVIIKVKTNKPWSLECTDGLISPVSDTGTSLEERTLTMHISDNPDNTPRTITVLVKSQGVVKETLTFQQLEAGNGGGGGTGTTFEFISANPANNATIPSTGVSATIKVNTDYAWWINYNGTKTTYTAGALGEKTGTLAIPANPTTANRIVTYTVGYDETTAETINYIQSGDGMDNTLEYQSSTLPTGNIPQVGGTYTFTFTGTYTGGVQVRALANGTAIATGTEVTNKQPSVAVTNNTLTTTRNITFQYKRADGDWVALPASTNRVQNGTGGGGGDDTFAIGPILPTGDVPELGKTYYCSFSGKGADAVIFRAFRNGREVARSGEGVVTPGSVTYGVAVPELEPDPNSYVYFEYSTNNGATWIDMNDRRWQKHDWIVVNTESITLYPAKNAGCRFYVSGTIQREVVMLAFVDGVQVNRVTCYPTPEQQVIFVSIPDNPGPNRRNVSFSWSYDNTIWSSTSLRPQAAP